MQKLTKVGNIYTYIHSIFVTLQSNLTEKSLDPTLIKSE